MQNHVFNKINMVSTDYSNANDKGTFAVPYAGFNKPAAVTPIVMNGAGGVATTSKDLALFDIELMNYYHNGNKEMFKAQKNTESAGGVYGLGIIPDTEIANLCKTVDIAVVISAVIVLIALSSLVFRIKKGRIHRLDDRKRRKRYVISSVVLLISAALYTLFLYTDIPFRVLLNMDNYFIFTFLPSVYMWVNVMLAVLAVCIIIRSGYTKKG